MEKGNASDLRALSDDLGRCIENHSDAIKHNPDLHRDIKRLRDDAYTRWQRVSERPREVNRD